MAPIPAAAKRLLDFIRGYEAPRGYDTVFGNRMAQMPKPITAMTVDEVIADGPRRTRVFGSSAAGGLQFMTATLKTLKAEMRLTGREVMTPALQDALGYHLLKRRGFAGFMAGTLGVTGFGLNLAKEWASFPVLAPTKGQHRAVARGQSFYRGDALNKALVPPEAVERVLRELRAAPVTAAADPEPAAVIAAPRVETVSSTAAAIALPWWARLLGRKTAAPAERPGLHPAGSPELWDAQRALRDRAYYTKGRLDGLDGPLTQEAVAQARKDNGLGDGGVDAGFLAALPGFPPRPVSAERLAMPITEAARQRPEVFSPVKWLAGLGVSAIGVGGADGSGLLDNLQATAGRANDVLGSAQTVIGAVTGIVAFVIEHRAWFLVGLGLFLLFKALGWALDAWIKVRRAFF